jgi:hypothetical protein
MDVSTFRPVVSGLIGAAVSIWLTRRWAKTLPTTFASKSIAKIVEENRTAVRVANAMFFVGLFTGVALYQFAGYSNRDWRPLAIGFGVACTMPQIALATIAWLSGRQAKEAFVAFSIGQGTPMWATYGSLALLAFVAIAGAIKSVT